MLLVLAMIMGIAVYVAVTYNGFVALQNRAINAWADIDLQLRRRHDLVPNLVATVKGYARHEKSVLERVTKLWARAAALDEADEREGVEADLTSALKSVIAVAENYPQLKTDEGFRNLHSLLAAIENHLACARRYYNAVVRDLDSKREVFPSKLIAQVFCFEPYPYFQVEEEDRTVTRVVPREAA